MPQGVSSKAIKDRPLSDVPCEPPDSHARTGVGRPCVQVDWEKVGAYLKKGLPLADVAALHFCSEQTLRRHAEAEGIDIESLYTAKRAEGRDKLLDQLHAHAEKWGPAAIFLSKQPQWLGYSDTAKETQIRVDIHAIRVEVVEAPERPQALEGQVRQIPAESQLPASSGTDES